MTREATTRKEYEAAFAEMNALPIVGEHRIGKLTITVNMKRWVVTDGVNTKHGPVRSGRTTRYDVHTALYGWLKYRNIR